MMSPSLSDEDGLLSEKNMYQGVGVRARGIRGGRIGVDPPRRGWRTQDDIVGGIDGPVDYSHMMADDWFGGN